MNKKKNLLNLFTEDVKYNYHLIKTEEPNGHLIYLIKNGSKLDKELYEFYPTLIVENLIEECEVKIEKFAPCIFFTEENNTDKLKYQLNNKLSEDTDFSAFIEEIKDEYRILEIKDSLLYKKDPEAYESAKQKEYEEHQKELWGELIEQMNNRKEKREKSLLEYDNNLIKLLKDVLEGVIEYEKRDFNLTKELEEIISNLIDPDTWIKIDGNSFICRIEPISLDTDKLNVFLTDNSDYSYTATLRFDKSVLITENIIKIEKGDILPTCLTDYEFLAKLFDVDLSNVSEWEYKDNTERFNYVIDYLVPIFKAEKERKEKELIDKILSKNEDLENENENDNNN